ncbi:hypothetical protein GCM10011519_01140 [Marmoricola endophyticus]|uniref:AMP-dependent synthetase/ligase domain-containing protein n=1 Tax=Marmoricola endophyticus TaxID=2040280 RepID=A0A917B8J6_9ACTN|nr:AMP-binding protein [Marmoricola endophyticus]GGF31559.1 hypothetical protein GCM10011519_01140 [Marmoricola endophyticus]
MREYATASDVDVPASGNLSDDLEQRVRETPELVLVRRPAPSPDGPGWRDLTALELREQVRAVAKGLVASGVEVGDRVGIWSRTRWEWVVADYAAWYAGAVSVPVYETSSQAQVEHVLTDAGVRALVVEDATHAAHVGTFRARAEDLHHVWAIEGGALDLLARLGGDVSDDELEARRTSRGPEDPATVIYTSGTTGAPKGCTLTHGNLRFEVEATTHALEPLYAADDASTLVVLPLAHVFPRVLQLACVRAGVATGHTSSITALDEDLRSFAPTFVLGVPRIFEMLFNQASQDATADGDGRRFARAVEVAMAWSRARSAVGDGSDVGATGRVPLRLRVRHAGFDRTVYRQVRDRLGGACRYAVSGGAPLGERLAHFYRGVGIDLLEGYGLTESAAALTVNTPGATRIGTVGRPLPGTAVRVSEDGELLFRGAQVFAGYWDDPESTAEALDGRRDRRGRVRPRHRSPAGDHRHRRRQERLPHRAGGAPALPPAGRPVPCGRRRTTGRRGAAHPRPRRTRRMVRVERSLGRAGRGPARRPRPPCRPPAGRRRREPVGEPRRGGPSVRGPAGPVDRGGRPAHPVAQAAALGPDARDARRRLPDVRPVSRSHRVPAVPRASA